MHSNIFLLTGPVHSGKTTRAGRLVDRIRSKGLRVSGFLAPGEFDGGVRSGFSLVDLEDGSRLPLATVRNKKGWTRYGRFFFNPAAMDKGKRIIERAIREQSRLVVIDEVGPMELAGRGWSELLNLLAESHEIIQLWVVRESLATEVSSRWRINPGNVLSPEGTRDETLFEKILGECDRT